MKKVAIGETVLFPDIGIAGVVEEIRQEPVVPGGGEVYGMYERPVIWVKLRGEDYAGGMQSKLRRTKGTQISEATATEMKSRLKYDLRSGEVTWRDGRQAGHVATSKGKKARMRLRWIDDINLVEFTFEIADVAWLLHTGFWPEFGVTHVDGNKMNNVWQNLSKRRKPRKVK